MNDGYLHDQFTAHGEEKKASEKSFGIVFSCLFALVAAFRFYHDKADAAWMLAAAFVLLCLAYCRPQLLKPFNRAWHQLSMLLFAITNPIIMGLIYFLTIAPTGLAMRLLRKDVLDMRYDETRSSYWKPRAPAAADNMKNQF